MIVCPVCENQQQRGDTCDVCGKQLVAAPPATEEYAALPELEQTGMPQVAVLPQAMPDLEVHRAGGVQVAPELVPNLEATALPPLGPVPVEALKDLDRTRLPDDGQRTVLGDAIACRYCGQVQARANRLCEKCANALPRFVPAPPPVEAARIRCRSCGTETEQGRVCFVCGFFPGT